MNSYRLPPDYHTHSALCLHATGEPIDYLRTAESKGLPSIAFTDHCPAPDGFNPEHRMQEDEFPTYREWVMKAEVKGACDVLFGVEADYYRGYEPFLEPFLRSQPFDIVLGSVHYLDYWAFDSFAAMRQWEADHVEEAWLQYFILMKELINTGLYDVLAHFDLPKKFGRLPSERRIREMVLPVLDRVREQTMAIEINISGIYHDIREMYPSPQILTWAYERGIPIVFGSDAHRPEHVASNFADAVALAKSVGYTNSARFKRREKTLCSLP